MPFIEELKTGKGTYAKDSHGVWHYLPDFGAIGPILDDALVHRPSGPSYFWNDNFPVLIKPEDSQNTLFERWQQEKEHFMTNASATDRAIIKDLRNTVGIPQDP